MKKNILAVLALMFCASTAHAYCNIPNMAGIQSSYERQQLQQQYNECLQNDRYQQQQLQIQQQQLLQQQQQYQQQQQEQRQQKLQQQQQNDSFSNGYNNTYNMMKRLNPPPSD